VHPGCEVGAGDEARLGAECVAYGLLPAVTACLAEGISVNVILIFSPERYGAGLNAFLTGLEQRAAAGGSLDGVESVASFFVSRVDTGADKRLAALPAGGAGQDTAADVARLHGQAAVANARLAHALCEDALASPRWKALAQKGARPQRLLWASTGVKGKASDDTRHVVDLVAPDTVNTTPEATPQAVAAHGINAGQHDPGQLRRGTDRPGRPCPDRARIGPGSGWTWRTSPRRWRRRASHRSPRAGTS